tara:strand:+ start:1494 stop:1772 length:279 start_codon:yes stop_codon:yes gene_type:complete
MLVNITSSGTVYGNATTFNLERNKQGQYELVRRDVQGIGKPFNRNNRVYVECIEEVRSKMESGDYYVILTSHKFNIPRRVARPFSSCQLITL